jgi:hypothetical protein
MATEVEVQKPSPSQFTHDYPDVRPDLALQGKQVDPSPETQRYQKLISELHSQMNLQGYAAASVINMNPFPLEVNGVLFDDIVVPACPPEQPFIRARIGHYKTFTADMGDAVLVPKAAVPVQLAYEFEREFQWGGGVFFYPGDIEPFDKNGNLVNTKVDRSNLAGLRGEKPVSIAELYKRAEDLLIKTCWKRVHYATAEFTRPNGMRNAVNELHRNAVKVLIARNRMLPTDKPAWAEIQRGEALAVEKCKVCRKDVEQGAVLCSNCGYVFDVEAAFEGGMIGMDNPQLRRLGAKKLLELDFSEEQVSALVPGFTPKAKKGDDKKADDKKAADTK